jgi:hypothetical protein
MKTVLKCAAVASALMLTAGSSAWAQGYSTSGTTGTHNQGSQGYNTGTQGYQGSYGANQGSWNAGTQGTNTYGTNQGTTGANQGSWNTGTQGTNPYGANQGTYGANQGSWNGGMGTSSPYTGQTYSSAGYGTGNIGTYQEAEQQLSKYGYSNVQGLRSMQGWSADAMRNGQRVHVLVGDNGLVATFPGR